jgi:hypothetical protein
MSYTHDVNEARDWFAADAASSERAVFLRRTYTHLCGAILAFMGLEAIFLSSDAIAEPMTRLIAGHWWIAFIAYMGDGLKAAHRRRRSMPGSPSTPWPKR